MESLPSKEERTLLAQEIFDEILSNILSTYEREEKLSKDPIIVSPQKPLTTHSKPIFLSDFAKAHNLSVFRTLDFSEKSPTKSFQLHHMEVHKQFVYNLCGYHTLFNLIQILKLIKSQDLSQSPSEIFNPASFWKFHFECTTSLDKYASDQKLDRTKYPWTYYHIRWGDLERSYVKPLTMNNKTFQEVITSDKNFKISHMTFEFQFKRLLYSKDGLERMQKEIDEFIADKNTPVHNIKMIMMGITNHWFLFFAHRYQDHIEFWMLDSKNRDFLIWKQEDIDQFLSQENEKRKKEGKIIMNNFRLWVAQNAMLDSQISTDLLVNCFLGNTTLYHFIADSEVRILSQGFIEMFLVNPELKIEEALDEISKRFEGKIKQNEKDEDYNLIVDLTVNYIEAYYETLSVLFFEEKAKYLYPSSKVLLTDINSLLLTILSNARDREDIWQINAWKNRCFYANIPIKFR